MSRDELLEFCHSLYLREGLNALEYRSLKQYKGLYWNLRNNGLTQKKLISALGIEKEYKGARKAWPWERCIKEARKVKERHSFLPPAAWFQDNGYASLVFAVYENGKTWEALRESLGDFNKSSFVESRNGIRWRSHPEASLSNYLYARGIEHKRGEKYPEDYARHSTAKYAYYDMQFMSKNGAWINVEIWGDKPHGHGEDRYREKRGHKEAYHAGRDDFLGIGFKDCFSDESLTEILKPYIGNIEPFCFEKPTDKYIESSHWSNADELLVACQALADSMPDGKFPTEEWLRKRGKWANRHGDSLNTMSVYIKLWLGGVRRLRQLLGQDHHSTRAWDRESAISEYKAFYETHRMTPDQYRHLYKRGSNKLSYEIAKNAINIMAAVRKYAGGGAAVNKLLRISIDRTRRWTKDSILEGYKKVIDQWGISPSQLISDYHSGKVQIEPEYAAEVQRLIGATSSQFPDGASAVYKALSFTPPSRPRKKRTRESTVRSK